uniref:BRD4 interacting chromatin remodeling complex associated protein n=1 Tax=Bubo bubo TaxID=30461 RepID=A0A8C0ENL2_BUBBB
MCFTKQASGNHLSTEPSQPTTSVDLDFLEDDILGSPASAGANLPNSEQPCDILQQSLQEANITEQTLEAEAELDLGSFQLPTLQPVVQAGSDGAPQIFSGGADLIGLQQPAVLTHQALVQQSVGAEVVNKTISVQPFLQQVGLGNVTIQPISNLQGLPNGSPGGTLGIGPIQVVGQQVMAINQPAQQIIAKQVQPSGVATMPVGSYITQTAPEQQQVTLASTGVSPQNAGLVIQKNVPTVATTTLNGNSMFGNVSGTQGSQPLTVTSNLSSPLVQAQNVIIHRTPTPIQPKPAGVLQQKLYQITPKPFGPNNTTLTIQNEAALQQQKAQQNLTFMAGKPGQNVVLSGFPQGLPANVFKQPPPQQQALSKPMSVHLLNQSSSIVIPAQHVPQAMLQGQNQFLLPGQLAGASAVQLPQQLSALPANMGGQILTTSHPGGQAHIITSQGPGGQLITNQALPAQILTNQNIAGQLNLGQVLTSQNAHGTAHILSAPIQLQPGQVGQPALFQMPVSLAGSLTTQSQPSVATSLGQTGQTVIQGVTLPNQVAMLNATENLGQAVSIQTSATSQSLGLGQPQPASGVRAAPGIPNHKCPQTMKRPQPTSVSNPRVSPTPECPPDLQVSPNHERPKPTSIPNPQVSPNHECPKPTSVPNPQVSPTRVSPKPTGVPKPQVSKIHKHPQTMSVPKSQMSPTHECPQTQMCPQITSVPNPRASPKPTNVPNPRASQTHVSPNPRGSQTMIVPKPTSVPKPTNVSNPRVSPNHKCPQLTHERPQTHDCPQPTSVPVPLFGQRSAAEAIDAPHDGPRGVITSRKSHDGPSGKNRPEENPKLLFLNRGDARSLVVQPKGDDGAGGLMKELAEVEDEFYRGMIKPEPPDQELTWEVPLPPAKRRKSESFEVDNASFSSDSPQDDSLNEHLQSAIDSILNLQQPQAGAQNVRTPSSSYNSSSSPFSSPVHRTDAYLAPSHNGGLGARTLNR